MRYLVTVNVISEQCFQLVGPLSRQRGQQIADSAQLVLESETEVRLVLREILTAIALGPDQSNPNYLAARKLFLDPIGQDQPNGES